MPYSPRSCTWKSLALLLFPLICLSQEPAPQSGETIKSSGINQAISNSETKNPSNPNVESKGTAEANTWTTAAIAGGVGAIIAALINSYFNLRIKRMDERRAIRDMTLQLSLTKWKEDTLAETARYAAEMSKYDIRMPKPPDPSIPSLEAVTLQMFTLSAKIYQMDEKAKKR